MIMEELIKSYFDKSITDRERAIFEMGIALGFVYHQFIGTPFRKDSIKILEKAIKSALLAQPFRVFADVKIKYKGKEDTPYSYGEISKKNLDVTVKIKYGKALVSGRLRFIKSVNYPLMYIEEIREAD